MSIYMKADDIEGNVTDQDHPNWIQLNTVDFAGVSNFVSMDVGDLSHRITTNPRFGQFTITKGLDASSNYLFQYAHSRNVIDEVIIHYVSTGDPNKTYFEIQLNNVFLSHFNQSHPGGDGYPSEQFNLSFQKIEQKYLGTDDSVNPIPSGYDLASATSM